MNDVIRLRTSGRLRRIYAAEARRRGMSLSDLVRLALARLVRTRPGRDNAVQ
jgi:hypothetical protein